MDSQLAHGIAGLDDAVTRFAVELRAPFVTGIVRGLTELGSWRVTLLVVIALALAASWRGDRRAALVAVVSWMVTGTLVVVLKAVTHRHRPDESFWLARVHGWSFPSHHAALAACAYTLLREQLESRTARWLALLVPLLVAATRVYLGVHYASDVTVGVLVGWAVVLAMNRSFGAHWRA